jgi:DNA-binding protein Fis
VLPIRRVATARGAAVEVADDAFVTDVRTLREVERAYCRHVLDLCDGNRTRASQVLDIGRNTLLRKLDGDS